MNSTNQFPTIRTSKSQGNAQFSRTAPESNPFRLPGDDQIFTMREEEKRKKQMDREENKSMKIWEKTANSITSRATRLRELIGEDTPMTLRDIGTKTDTKSKSATSLAQARRQEKENMVEFIAKKREMFLVQMSLDTKREEIRKLEEKAQMKEDALQRSEQMLEEDANRFESFLKENDKKAHDAIKRAEEETKRKQERTQEVKRLTQQIQTLTSEMSKHKEALDDCMKYKRFLDMLTPPEWFEQHKRNQIEKKERLRKEKYEKRYKEWENLRKRLIEQHRKELESKKDKKTKGGLSGLTSLHTDEEEEDVSSRISIPPAPKLDDEAVDMVAEEPPMYFSHPQQLLGIFAALEEQNLFLIQNSQETEHTLEELRQAYKQTKQEMDGRTGQLQGQIDDLDLLITAEESRARSLQAKRMTGLDGTIGIGTMGGTGNSMGKTNTSSQSGGQSQIEKEKLLEDLHRKVQNVYEQCGFDASSKPSTLFMLSQLESKLEQLLTEIERMPTEHVIKAEREKEKRRRERKRLEQQELQEKLQEERNKRAIERSLQAPKKRLGRQVMFRSKPIRQEKKNDGDDNSNKDNNDELKFL
mmetsp:Transcript_5223/g.5352  ORF Transcript_5223/g.5352 Transcript_5223/m.5352 type:complete len:586 (-) Transcript_5223:47-1804(-)|eukprot:CAMPEP_0182422416 /NCGR_PEP_ID=MMETSP1167-20130531/8102_1 /TAXON_ID=2988 /ORGANISM="Mallomonas Sp, Strain CCMP3275" /LENGTH=585 /DNA_ID=CAMNT_0024600463 /DNA_START=98 /DNA_END=1855 /DNA_ORIENTATION=+